MILGHHALPVRHSLSPWESSVLLRHTPTQEQTLSSNTHPALTLFHISRDLALLAHSVLSVPSIWASLFSLAEKHHPVLPIPVLHRYGSLWQYACGQSTHTSSAAAREPSDSTDQGIRKCLSSRALLNDSMLANARTHTLLSLLPSWVQVKGQVSSWPDRLLTAPSASTSWSYSKPGPRFLFVFSSHSLPNDVM